MLLGGRHIITEYTIHTKKVMQQPAWPENKILSIVLFCYPVAQVPNESHHETFTSKSLSSEVTEKRPFWRIGTFWVGAFIFSSVTSLVPDTNPISSSQWPKTPRLFDHLSQGCIYCTLNIQRLSTLHGHTRGWSWRPLHPINGPVIYHGTINNWGNWSIERALPLHGSCFITGSSTLTVIFVPTHRPNTIQSSMIHF